MEESVSGQDDTNPVFSLATSAAKMVRYRCTRAKGPNGRSLSPFHQYETPRSIATSPLNGMLVHHRVTVQQYVASTHFIHLGEGRQSGVKFLV